MSRLKRILTPILAAALLLGTGAPAAADDETDEPDTQSSSGELTGAHDGGPSQVFFDAGRQHGSSPYMLVAIFDYYQANNSEYPMGIDEDHPDWDLIIDPDHPNYDSSITFREVVDELADHLYRAETKHTKNPSVAIDAGYTMNYTISRDPRDSEEAETHREEAQSRWTAAISELPIEDAEAASDAIFRSARGWMTGTTHGASLEECEPMGEYDGDDDESEEGDEDAQEDEDSSSDNTSGGSGGGKISGVSFDIPAEYVGAISEAAQYAGFDPAILAAQLYQESSFNPNAVSPAGAQGLAQFMPGTWRSEWGDPFNPMDSIHAQGVYMAEVRAVMEPHAENEEHLLELTLAGYNAGPYNTGFNFDASPATIPPFPETMDYVVKIPEMAGGVGTISSGNCSFADVPNLGDMECEARPDIPDYQWNNEPVEQTLHEAAIPGFRCGVAAFDHSNGGQVQNWGGRRGTQAPPTSPSGLLYSDHNWGGAMDIDITHIYQTTDGQDYGTEIAEWYMTYADELGVSMVIWWERQWMATEPTKPFGEWSSYTGCGFGASWSPIGAPPQSAPLGGGDDNCAHRNHPHVSFDPFR